MRVSKFRTANGQKKSLRGGLTYGGGDLGEEGRHKERTKQDENRHATER